MEIIPTEEQLRAAQYLKIDVPAKINKMLSQMVSDAKAKMSMSRTLAEIENSRAIDP